MGRPSKLKPWVHADLVLAVDAGASLTTAARAVGVDPGTLFRWLHEGQEACEEADVDCLPGMSDDDLAAAVGEDKVAVARLYLELRAAELGPVARASTTLWARVQQGNWRAAQEYLRRNPQFARNEPVGWFDAKRIADPRRRQTGLSVGRPSKLSVRVTDEMVRLISEGYIAGDAASCVGIDRTTFWRWMRRGYIANEEAFFRWENHDDDDHSDRADPGVVDVGEFVDERERPYFEFYTKVSAAQADCVIYATEVWRTAAQTDWRAAKAFLEYRYPERWEPTPKRGAPDPRFLTPMSTPTTEREIVQTDEERLEELLRAVDEAGLLDPA